MKIDVREETMGLLEKLANSMYCRDIKAEYPFVSNDIKEVEKWLTGFIIDINSSGNCIVPIEIISDEATK